MKTSCWSCRCMGLLLYLGICLPSDRKPDTRICFTTASFNKRRTQHLHKHERFSNAILTADSWEVLRIEFFWGQRYTWQLLEIYLKGFILSCFTQVVQVELQKTKIIILCHNISFNLIFFTVFASCMRGDFLCHRFSAKSWGLIELCDRIVCVKLIVKP